ncbi:unnamed protein product [Amoebophrya sp. A120]|nr:unnamed protein product [Amoebophrya sp. A120]|eukprot:GSA120T00000173001.1
MVLCVFSARRSTATFFPRTAGGTSCTAVVVARRFCSSLLLFLFLGTTQKVLLFTRATTTFRDEGSTSSRSDAQAGKKTTTTTRTHDEHEEQKLPRTRGRPTTAPVADDFFDDDVRAGDEKNVKTRARASSYTTYLHGDAVFDIEESRTPIKHAATPAASGRAALEVGAAGTGGIEDAPGRTTSAVDEEGEDEILEKRADEGADVLTSEHPEHDAQQEAKPEMMKQERSALLEGERVVVKNTQHHHPNLRGGRPASSGSSLATSSRAEVTSSSMVALQEVVVRQIDEEKSSFLNSTASSKSSAEGEKSDELFKSSDFVQKTAGSVVNTRLSSSGETTKMKAKEKEQLLHQEKQQQRTTVQVGDLLGCVCSAGGPSFSLPEAFLRHNPWARVEPVCKPPAFCPIFGRPYYVPWNAPVSLVDQFGKSAGLLKAAKDNNGLFTSLNSLLSRYLLGLEEEPPRTGGRSPGGVEAAAQSSPRNKVATTWRQRAQALVEAAQSRIFSTPTDVVDGHVEQLFRELDAEFDAEEGLDDGLDVVDPRLLENPPPGALVSPVAAVFDLDEVDSDGRGTGLRGRWDSPTNADPFLLRFTPDLDVPHSHYRMSRVTQFSELFPHDVAQRTPRRSPPAAEQADPGKGNLHSRRDNKSKHRSMLDVSFSSDITAYGDVFVYFSSIISAWDFATSADRAVFEAPPRLHNMCVESCILYMYEYVTGGDAPEDKKTDDPAMVRALLRVHGALVRYAEDPESPGAVSKVGFFGDPDAVAAVLHAREPGAAP